MHKTIIVFAEGKHPSSRHHRWYRQAGTTCQPLVHVSGRPAERDRRILQSAATSPHRELRGVNFAHSGTCSISNRGNEEVSAQSAMSRSQQQPAASDEPR
ncbi:hypothetical protein AB7M49_003795 [Bradyrhizobium elkanii]